MTTQQTSGTQTTNAKGTQGQTDIWSNVRLSQVITVPMSSVGSHEALNTYLQKHAVVFGNGNFLVDITSANFKGGLSSLQSIGTFTNQVQQWITLGVHYLLVQSNTSGTPSGVPI